jgi:hypothetical protein
VEAPLSIPRFDEPVIVREAEAETVGRAPTVPSRTGTTTPPRRSSCSTAPPASFRATRSSPPAPVTSSSARRAPNASGAFRHLRRVALGEAAPESLPEVQDRHDDHFLSSAARDARHREAAPGETV